MKDSLILEGKIYISAKRAARILNYAQDYIGQLCRSGKLDCKMIGRSWYLTEESLLSHREQAIDSTQERVVKVVKNISEEKNVSESSPVVVERKLEVKSVSVPSTIVEQAPVVAPSIVPVISSPITPAAAPVVSPFTSFKYEAENKPALPQITKKLPAGFTLPKKVADLTSTPFATKIELKKIQSPGAVVSSAPVVAPNVAPNVAPKVAPKKAPIVSPIQEVRMPAVAAKVATMNIPTSRTLTVGVLTILLLAASYMFAVMGRDLQKLAKNDSRTPSVVSSFMNSIGFGRSSPIAAIPKSPEVNLAQAPSPFNGIGVVPSTGSVKKDEAEKERIKRSFSDDVAIFPDQSGTAGIIKPVFLKGSGDEFTYVLVPVKENKQ